MKILVPKTRGSWREFVKVEYRCDPIPGSGGDKRRRTYQWRHPKTTQERRYFYDMDHKQFIRGRRNHVGLPSVWDDIYHLRRRNWKEFRKTQYRKIVNMGA